jgi:hypothetical protein
LIASTRKKQQTGRITTDLKGVNDSNSQNIGINVISAKKLIFTVMKLS